MQPQPVTPAGKPGATEKSKFVVVACNGTALYVLAYYLVWGLHQTAKWQVSRYYGLRGYWNPSRITYSLGNAEWWRTAIVAVNGIGPLVCALAGAAAFWFYWKRERARRGNVKLLLLWVAMHGCNAVFGALLADTFTQSGFWYVSDWLFLLGNAMNVVLAILAGLVQLGVGYWGAVAFLQAHDSKTVMRYENRQWMVLSTLLAPWVVGSACIVLAKLPYITAYEALHLLLLGLLVVPLGLGCLKEAFSGTVKRPLATKVAWGLVGLALAAAVGWRLLLSPPVSFG